MTEQNKPQFIIQQVSNVGTGHPYVARLMFQTIELLKWTNLSQEEKDAVGTLYKSLKDRLVKCEAILKELIKRFDDQVKNNPLSISGSGIVSAPYLIDLEREAENFLYEAKNYLRDLTKVLNAFHGSDFNKASDWYDPRGKGQGKVSRWLIDKFGKYDQERLLSADDQVWIGELIRKRNAVEHPGERSGTLYVNNFYLLSSGKYAPPTWHRDDNDPTQILQDIENYCHNLFTFAEELLVFGCVSKRMNDMPVAIGEVPEDKRKPENPRRFVVVRKT